jgi:hypothetical protein
LHQRQREPGALREQRDRHAFGQPQRIEHELEADLIALDGSILGERRPALGFLDILLRLLVPDLTHDALLKRQLRMGAGADAQIIAEAPVVDVVPAFGPGLV